MFNYVDDTEVEIEADQEKKKRDLVLYAKNDITRSKEVIRGQDAKISKVHISSWMICTYNNAHHK